MTVINKTKAILKSKNIQNSGWIISQQAFQMVLQLVVGIFTARYLGPSNYGSLNYTASFVAFFSSIVTLGMEGVVIKKLIDYPNEEGLYLGSSMMFRLISSLLSIFSISVIVYFLNPDEPIKLILVLLQSCQLSFKAVQILDSWFQRHLKSKYVSIGKLIACIAVSAYKVFLLINAKSIVWFALSNSLSDVVVAVLEIIFYRKANGQRLRFNLSVAISILRESYHFIISGLMVALYSQMDRVMIGQMMTDADVGFYTTATAICGMWVFVPLAIISSFQPTIMEVKKHGNESLYLLRLKQLYSAIIWLCILSSVVISIFAKPAVLILYGADFSGAVGVLRISIWHETFAMIGTARSIWILCENKNKYVKYYLLIGAGVNLVLNSLLIPYLGIRGAAIATLITQITTSMIAPLLFKETRIHTIIVLKSVIFKWS